MLEAHGPVELDRRHTETQSAGNGGCFQAAVGGDTILVEPLNCRRIEWGAAKPAEDFHFLFLRIIDDQWYLGADRGRTVVRYAQRQKRCRGGIGGVSALFEDRNTRCDGTRAAGCYGAAFSGVLPADLGRRRNVRPACFADILQPPSDAGRVFRAVAAG